MRAALIDDNFFVINVIVVNDYKEWPSCIPAENSGNIGDWRSQIAFVSIWDANHPKYNGPYIPPT